MMNIIGEKEVFAIEYTVSKIKPHLFGHICIWLNGSYIGYTSEEVMLDCSLGSLIELVSEDRQNRLLKINVPTLSDKGVFDFLSNDDGDIRDDTMFNVDESTDDFIIHIYRLGDRIKFLWKLCERPCRDIKNYSSGLLTAEIKFNYIVEIVEEFDFQLGKLKSE